MFELISNFLMDMEDKDVSVCSIKIKYGNYYLIFTKTDSFELSLQNAEDQLITRYQGDSLEILCWGVYTAIQQDIQRKEFEAVEDRAKLPALLKQLNEFEG